MSGTGDVCIYKVKLRFLIRGMHMPYLNAYATLQQHMRHCGIHMFRTPPSPSDIFFLGKPACTLESDGWIWNFITRVVKFWIQHQSLHGAICFVTFAYTVAHVESHHMFTCFPFLSHSHILNLGLSCCSFCVLPIWRRVHFFFPHLEIGFMYGAIGDQQR